MTLDNTRLCRASEVAKTIGRRETLLRLCKHAGHLPGALLRQTVFEQPLTHPTSDPRIAAASFQNANSARNAIVPSEVSALWIRRAPTIVITLVVLLVMAFVMPAIQSARETARRTQSRNNLRQIGLGLSNYHGTFMSFPSGGTFSTDGIARHSWTTFLEIYMAQTPFFLYVDFNVPWDDPLNIDLFLQHRANSVAWWNPSLTEQYSSDGLSLTHYAANDWIMHRNSDVGEQDLANGLSSTATAGDANGAFDPLGYPYNWRNLTAGIGQPESGFGCPGREVTMFLMADGNIRVLSNGTDRQVIISMSGPADLQPNPDQTARPAMPYRLPKIDKWRFYSQHRSHKSEMTFRLSPDKVRLKIDFGYYSDPEDATTQKWLPSFRSITKDASLEHIEVSGELRAHELNPFLEIASLRRLTISNAKIADDKDAVLKTARRDIEID